MKVGIPKEIHPGERRVAATTETVTRLKKQGFEVMVESGAGAESDVSDEAYTEAGAEVVSDPMKVWTETDIVMKVREPEMHPGTGMHEADMLKEGGTLISFIWPAQNEELVQKLAARKATVLAMDAVPRISRAQKLDARSSMANVSGYRAVVEAAQHFGRFFNGQITAAGKFPPARILVIGGGVAGLASIGAARGLGAQVVAFDTRPAVQEQVESMGAEYLTVEMEEDGSGQGGYAKVMSEEFMEMERKLFEDEAHKIDVIITTALIPGKPAPYLVTEQVLKNMKDGSVLVDLAAEQGGNCPLVEADKVVVKHGVTLIGYTDLPSRMPGIASRLYGNNLCHLLDDMGKAEGYKVDEEDDVVRGALILRDGEMKWPPPPPKVEAQNAPPKKKEEPAPAAPPPKKKSSGGGHHAPEPEGPANPLILIALGIALFAVGMGGSNDFLSHFTVFVLACFVGYQVVWNVTAALHTPLMSVTNAISGIIIVGGMLQIGGDITSPAALLGLVAIAVATINIAGGFLVTSRMLKMFRK
jgi:NAD(P) transhydrogenase subunit alpha